MIAEKVTLDSNLLIYAADNKAGVRNKLAAQIVLGCARIDCVLSVQVLSEFFHAVTRKGKMDRAIAAEQVKDWIGTFPVIAPSAKALAGALDLNVGGQCGFWDGVLVATAEQAGCTLLISEDMHDGMKYGELRVRNPFAGAELVEDIRALIDVEP